jgi:hypothetical protein
LGRLQTLPRAFCSLVSRAILMLGMSNWMIPPYLGSLSGKWK